MLYTFLGALFFFACSSSQKFTYKDVPNTPMPGFDLQHSDPAAVALADSVMKAMGGRNQWDMTRFIRWTYLGKRALIWDKQNSKARIDFMDRDLRVAMDLNNMTGAVRKDGALLTQPDSLKKYLQLGKEIFLNDAYWLVMPFKLKDAGVALRYLGKKENQVGALCDVLQLTFNGKAAAPQNKYLVWINPSSHLITQWAFFEKETDEKPALITPWQDYRALGHIMLSTSRGEFRSLAPLGVYTAVPDSVFTTVSDINWSKIK